MENSLTLYRTIMEFVWQNGVRFHDLRALYGFIWSLVGLLLSHKVYLSEWLLYRPGAAKAASKQRQLSRWLHNPRIEPMKVYRPLVRKTLQEFADQTIYLALDSSRLWNRFTIVRLALIYRGRALPLTWVILASETAKVKFSDYQPLIMTVATLLPNSCRAVLLADRGFNDRRLFHLVHRLGWHFRVRLRSAIWVYRQGKSPSKIGRLMPAKGEALFLHKVWILKQRYGPVHLALAHVLTPDGYEQWAIVSDEPTGLATLDEYGLRFDIEENFLDDKSAGFEIQSSQIRDERALSRLGLILATATLYLVCTGTAVVSLGYRQLVDPHWKRGLSYFQIGWRWIKYALHQGKRLLSCFWLEPGPDPEFVVASKKQAALPNAMLYSLRLET
jgi:hypothetical protein